MLDPPVKVEAQTAIIGKEVLISHARSRNVSSGKAFPSRKFQAGLAF